MSSNNTTGIVFKAIFFISLLHIGTIFANRDAKGYCREDRTFDKYSSTWIHWSTTNKDNMAISVQLCLTAEGRILTRRCKHEQHSSPRWEDVTKPCEGIPEEVTILLYQLSMVRATPNNAEAMSSQLWELTRHCEQLQEASLEYVTKTMEHIAIGCKTTDKITPTIFKVLNNMLTCLNESTFISSEKLLKTSSRIVKLLTEFSQRSNSDFDVSNIMFAARKVTSENLSNEMLRIGLQKGNTIASKDSLKIVSSENPRKFDVSDYKTTVVLPTNIAKSITVVVYKKSVLFMPYNVPRRNANWKMKYHDITISVIFSSDSVLHKFNKTVTFSFNKEDITYPNYAKCFNNNGNGSSWSTECKTTLQSGNIICQCHTFHNNTMTVTVIEEFDDNVYERRTHHKVTWNYITYIGSALSLFCLSIIIVTYLIYRKWEHGTRHHVLFHLSVALCADVLTLLLSHQLSYSETRCIIIAALQHFCTLSVACWMLTGSLVQFLCIVKERGDNISGFILKAVSFAWGIPILFVTVAALINHNLYGNIQIQGMCWMEHNFSIYAFAIPLMAILILNSIILSLILNTLCCKPKSYFKTSHVQWTIAKRRCIAALITMIILGFKWAFYYLAMEGHHSMQSTIAEIMILYLHFIFFPSQGFFIFVLQFIWDPTVQISAICRRRSSRK